MVSENQLAPQARATRVRSTSMTRAYDAVSQPYWYFVAMTEPLVVARKQRKQTDTAPRSKHLTICSSDTNMRQCEKIDSALRSNRRTILGSLNCLARPQYIFQIKERIYAKLSTRSSIYCSIKMWVDFVLQFCCSGTSLKLCRYLCTVILYFISILSCICCILLYTRIAVVVYTFCQ